MKARAVALVGYGVTAPEYGWDDYKGRDVKGATVDGEIVDQWVFQGWAVLSQGCIALSAEGWLRLDGLAAALTATRSH